MNISRIEIPTTAPDPPPPHFDDEATVVSARQVVPIAMARVVERKRAALWISLILLSSAACGALGAIGVNYFERRPAAFGPAPQNEIARPQINQAPNSNASDSTAAGGPTVSPSLQPAAALPANGSPPNDSSATVLPQVSPAQTTENQPATTNIPSEPGLLVRKRRVHPSNRNEENSSPRRKASKTDRGAGRIQEIFEGQGPP